MGKSVFYYAYATVLTFVLATNIAFAGDNNYESWGRIPGAKITNSATVNDLNTTIGMPLGNCNPLADPTKDSEKTNDYEKSCINQGITRDSFKVKVIFDPKEPINNDNSTETRPGPPTLPTGTTTVWNSSKESVTVTSGCNDIPASGSTPLIPKQFDCTAGRPIRFIPSRSYGYGTPITMTIPTSGYVKDFGTANNPLPGTTDLIYSTTVSNSDPSLSCTAGAKQPYGSGVPIKTKECVVVKDRGKCIHDSASASALGATAKAAMEAKIANPGNVSLANAYNDAMAALNADPAVTDCNTPLLGGAISYDAYGIAVTQNGAMIVAVSGPNITVPSTRTLYHTVFPQISGDQIDETAAAEFEVGLADIVVPYDSMQARFVARANGPLLCVYAYLDEEKEWRVEGDFPKNLNEVYDEPVGHVINADNQPTIPRQYSSMPEGNCVPMPASPNTTTPLKWSSLVSKVCTDNNASSSQFRWGGPNGPVRSGTGIIVECIEDTMMKLFYPTAENPDGATFFSALQARLKTLIRLLMVLYVIFFGYKLMMGAEVPKRQEWTWLMLKLVLVAYFAAGSGMTDLLPAFRAVTNDVSSIVLEAGLKAVDSDKDNLTYSYCDFRDTNKYIYPSGKEYMKLFDMVDCKISTYLGIGDSEEISSAPMIIVAALLAPVSVSLGIPIFFIALMVIVTLISITVRIVHIYVMAFMAVMMLVYISPIVIPAAFFEMTKGTFAKWMEQLIGFILQPIILFAFLSFMFVILDGVMFGGNHSFRQEYVPMQLENEQGKITQNNMACGTGSDSKCHDTNAPAYIFQVMDIIHEDWPAPEFSFIRPWHVDFRGHELALFVGLCKMLLVSFIAYCLLATVESMSGRLVALAEGAEVMATAPVVGPAETMQATAGMVGGAKDAAYHIGEKTFKGVLGGGKLAARGASGLYNLAAGTEKKKKAAEQQDKNRELSKAAGAASKAQQALKAAKEKKANQAAAPEPAASTSATAPKPENQEQNSSGQKRSTVNEDTKPSAPPASTSPSAPPPSLSKALEDKNKAKGRLARNAGTAEEDKS